MSKDRVARPAQAGDSKFASLLLDSAPDGVMLLTPKASKTSGRPPTFLVAAANLNAGTFLCGKPLPLGRDLLSTVPWLEAAGLGAWLSAVAESGNPCGGDLAAPDSEGGARLHFAVHGGADRLVLRVAPLAEAGRSVVEQSLRNSEQRFKDLAEATSDWVWEMDAELRFSYMSPRLTEVTGIDTSRVLGRTRVELGRGSVDVEKWRRHLEDLEARRPFRDFHYTFVRDDGQAFHWSISGKPLFDEAGVFIGYRGTGTDITKEANARHEAARAHRRLIDAIESLNDGFALFDADDRLVIFNSRYREIFPELPWDRTPGITFEEKLDLALAAGRVMEPLAYADPQAWRRQRLERHRNPPPHPLEMQLRNGSWYLVSERPTSEGGIVAIFVDITDIKAQEQRLRDAEARQARTIAALSHAQEKLQNQADELSDLAERYAREKDRAEAANRAKSTFLANMSHELRTPLNAILGFSEVIRDRLLGPPDKQIYADYAADIHRSGSHLLDLINGMLDMSKIEAGKWELQLGCFSFEEMLEASIRILAQRAEEAGIALVREIAPLPLLVADERAMRQVCLNLIANAIKFTPEGGRVTVRAERDDGCVAISVIDTGIGIAEQDLPRLGQPFVQVGAATTERLGSRNQGTGLGLAISRALIELHGGTLEIESALGEGTTVRFVLPLVEAGRQSSRKLPA